jgi:Flp pilus assembly protein TadD
MPGIVVLSDPLSAEEHLALGVAYERKGETDLAIREYERALRKGGESFRARVNLGNALLAKTEYGKARDEYRKALAIRPGDPEAANNLAWTAVLSGEGLGEAEGLMEEVVSREGNRTATFLDTLGVVRMRLGRTSAAQEALNDAESACLRGGEAACSGEVLGEIRRHQRELRDRIHPPPRGSLVE